jgi:transcriptional regulator with XRE-family HTH domain
MRNVAQLRKCSDHGRVGDVETIGQRIKRERLSRDMTQRDLAEKAGVGVPHISKVEAGRESPGDPLLLRLAQIFEVDAEELFLVARRLPDEIAEEFAADPGRVLAFYRTLRGDTGKS